MRLILHYLRTIRKPALALICFTAIFALVFSLYHLPIQAVAYAAALCAFIGLPLLIVDFFAFRARVRQLDTLRQEVLWTLEHLPVPKNLIEAHYQDLLESVHEERLSQARHSQAQYTDMMAYYTLWVHQIKTPIAAIRLLLQSTPLPQNKEVLEELQRIEHYVEMVLCYLRLDAGSTDYVFKRYDLDAIIRQAARKYAGQFIRRHIKLAYEPLGIEVLTDEKWLLFMLEQLLSNALKYTPEGTITIYLESPATLCIQDTGIGIAPEDLPRVFEQGFTGYNGRADKKSTGIGLYLCQRIAKNLGHSISIHSTPGEGTTVKVKLESAPLEVE